MQTIKLKELSVNLVLQFSLSMLKVYFVKIFIKINNN